MTNQMNLIEGLKKPGNIPLAEKARPTNLDTIFGQEKLLASNGILRGMIDKDEYSSFILWGPPGSGKTTIIRIIEQNTDLGFSAFSAVLSKIAKVKELMERADYLLRAENRKTIIFVDEIHRFNKSQQDAFLPYVESGAIILLGATTENPSFEVIPALLSRCHVFTLEQLSQKDILCILENAIEILTDEHTFSKDALSLIAENSGGDARKAINLAEMIHRRAGVAQEVTLDFAEQAMTSRSLFYDKGGEEHYNLISAFQKSIRGSDPQAALYWMARMLESGEDPLYLVRRLVRIASEDIGLADPGALTQAIAVKDAVHFLGMPEANTAMTQLVVYLATAPKSNACEAAYLRAREDALKSGHQRVPLHICNAPTKLMKDIGYGKDYKYSHNYENNYSYQNYFPDGLEEKEYYTPSQFGFEREIKKRLSWWEKLKDSDKKKKE